MTLNMHPTPCTLLKSAAPGEKCGLVAFRSPSCPFVDIFFGRRGSASIPPPHQPSPGGSASATSPRGGSDSGVQTGNILYTINPERGRPHLGARASRPHLIPANNLHLRPAPLQSAPNAFTISSIVPGLVRAGRPRSQGWWPFVGSFVPLRQRYLFSATTWLGVHRCTASAFAWWLGFCVHQRRGTHRSSLVQGKHPLLE